MRTAFAIRHPAAQNFFASKSPKSKMSCAEADWTEAKMRFEEQLLNRDSASIRGEEAKVPARDLHIKPFDEGTKLSFRFIAVSCGLGSKFSFTPRTFADNL